VLFLWDTTEKNLDLALSLLYICLKPT
ncbi:uncharacterized protein METZ01_LOCUS502652, partial [marine metagenome]